MKCGNLIIWGDLSWVGMLDTDRHGRVGGWFWGIGRYIMILHVEFWILDDYIRCRVAAVI